MAPAATIFTQLKQLMKVTLGLSKSSSSLITTILLTCVCSSSSWTTLTTSFWTTIVVEPREARDNFVKTVMITVLPFFVFTTWNVHLNFLPLVSLHVSV